MARLDPEQTSFMAQCRDLVVERGEWVLCLSRHPLIAGEASVFEQVNHSNEYHKRYWYTSQLFDPDWAPRDTLEHAPPVETPSEGSHVA
jgi:hypothetical protein